MTRQVVGCSDLSVSPLCLGGANFGGVCDAGQTARVIDAFIDGGGNFIDTADVYNEGRSEMLIGEAIRTRRGQIVLSTKAGLESETRAQPGGGSAASIDAAIEASLRRLAVDHIDLFHLHVPDPSIPIDETFDALDRARQAGKIAHAGVSNFAGWQLAEAVFASERLNVLRPVALQAQYSLLVRDIEHDLSAVCERHDIGIIAWAPLAGGILTGKYDVKGTAPAGTRLADSPNRAHPLTGRAMAVIDELRLIGSETDLTVSQVALKWVSQRSGVVSTIFGARSAEQVLANMSGSKRLGADAVARLDAVSAPRLPYPHDLHAGLGCRPPL